MVWGRALHSTSLMELITVKPAARTLKWCSTFDILAWESEYQTLFLNCKGLHET